MNNSKFRKEEVLFIETSCIPENVIEHIPYKNGDRLVRHVSEFSPFGDKDHWGNHLTHQNIEQYFDCHLVVDHWLINTGYDFTGVKHIFFDTM